MDINELAQQFPKVMKFLCEHPEVACALENDKAAVMPIIEAPIVHRDATKTTEIVRTTQSRFLNCRLDKFDR